MQFSLLDIDYFIDSKFIKSEIVYIKQNQLLTPVSTSLDHVGKIAIVKNDYTNVVAGRFVFQITPLLSSEIFSRFLEISLSAPQFYDQIKKITNLSGQALYNIPKSKLLLHVTLIPSLDEQE